MLLLFRWQVLPCVCNHVFENKVVQIQNGRTFTTAKFTFPCVGVIIVGTWRFSLVQTIQTYFIFLSLSSSCCRSIRFEEMDRVVSEPYPSWCCCLHCLSIVYLRRCNPVLCTKSLEGRYWRTKEWLDRQEHYQHLNRKKTKWRTFHLIQHVMVVFSSNRPMSIVVETTVGRLWII